MLDRISDCDKVVVCDDTVREEWGPPGHMECEVSSGAVTSMSQTASGTSVSRGLVSQLTQ